MFSKLFSEGGLSLDRLKALLAVAATGSIIKASGGDPVKQSQYSRQIKELEEFFRIKLIERSGKGVRLTANGRELARISRFFLLGLSNFQRGCLAEEQTFRIGASATVIQQFLLPIVSSGNVLGSDTRYTLETVNDDEIERRLHDLTLDFGVTTRTIISRPLQLAKIGTWKLNLIVPRTLHKAPARAILAFRQHRLPLALAARELDSFMAGEFVDHDCQIVCDSFVQAVAAVEKQRVAAIVPDFLKPAPPSKGFLQIPIPGLTSTTLHFQLAWNPRLLRLNPHAEQRKAFLNSALTELMTDRRPAL